MIIRCSFHNREQILACADLCSSSSLLLLRNIIGEKHLSLIYSDPPWNPGNEKYWRRHAGASAGAGYHAFVQAWCQAAKLCISQGAQHILCEQSARRNHKQILLEKAQEAQWSLPLLEEWTVFYGSPGSASVRRPNSLLHFGRIPLRTNPEGMVGEAMTIRACAGLTLPPGAWIVDFCMGKGMTSRMAHYFDWNCIGIEINQSRLDKTISWLRRQGYVIEEAESIQNYSTAA